MRERIMTEGVLFFYDTYSDINYSHIYCIILYDLFVMFQIYYGDIPVSRKLSLCTSELSYTHPEGSVRQDRRGWSLRETTKYTLISTYNNIYIYNKTLTNMKQQNINEKENN